MNQSLKKGKIQSNIFIAVEKDQGTVPDPRPVLANDDDDEDECMYVITIKRTIIFNNETNITLKKIDHQELRKKLVQSVASLTQFHFQLFQGSHGWRTEDSYLHC